VPPPRQRQINLTWGGNRGRRHVQHTHRALPGRELQRLRTDRNLNGPASVNDVGGSTTYAYPCAPDTNGTGVLERATNTAAATFTAREPVGECASGSQINSLDRASETGGTNQRLLIERCQGAACSTFARSPQPTVN